MKLTTLVALVAMAFAPISQATAHSMEHSSKRIKLFNDAAAALSSTNPDLSSRMKSYADREATETKESEKTETDATRSQDAQLLQDSANALQSTRPDLAKKLKKYATKEQKHMMKGGSSGQSKTY